MMKKIKVKYIGEDDWGRKLYQNVDVKKFKRIYVDIRVNCGRGAVLELHTTSPDGEPDTPLRKDIIIEVVKNV